MVANYNSVLTQTPAGTNHPVGTTVDYEFVVTNIGDAEDPDIQINVFVPSDVTWTRTPSGGATVGGNPTGTGNHFDNFDSGNEIPVGESITVTYQITKTVTESITTGITLKATDQFGNTAGTTGNRHTSGDDSNYTQNWTNKTTAGADTRNPGDVIVSTVSVPHYLGNTGNHTIVDPVPAGATRTYTAVFEPDPAIVNPPLPTATGFTANGTGPINDTITMSGSGKVVYTVNDTITAANAPTYQNTATIDGQAAPGPEITIDAPPAPLTMTDPADQTNTTDYSDQASTFTVSGGTAPYTVVSDNPNVTITDNGGGNYTATASRATNGAETATITATDDVADSVNESVTFTWNVTATAPVLEVTKTTGAGPFTAPTDIVSTVVYSNTGDATATGVTIADAVPAVPAGTTRVWTAVAAGGATGLAANGAGDINAVIDLPAGASYTITVTDSVVAAGTYENETAANLPGDPPVTTTGGPRDVTDTPTPTLEVTKTTGAGPHEAPTTVVSTVVYSNSGAGDATGVETKDPVPTTPTGTTRAWTAVAAGGATGMAANGVGGIDELVDLPAGASYTVTITDTVTAAGTYENIGSIGLPGDPPTTATGGPRDVTETPEEPADPDVCPPEPILGAGGPGAGGSDAIDTEDIVLCDKLDDGSIVGTAISVRRYDEAGIPVGAPEFVIPGTNDPYVVQGTLSPCEQCQTSDPQTFFFTTTTTGPVDFPGRSFSGDFPLSIGKNVTAISIGGTNFPVAITWSILDVDGTEFAAALQTAIQQRVRGSEVTVTPPTVDLCSTAGQLFNIEIACIDADDAPDSIDIIHDSGTDLILNPAFLRNDGSAAFGPGTFGQQRRTDAGGDIGCTDQANVGWQTNDQAGQFEQWGAGFLGTTPTPRGTGIQEINANGSGQPSPNSGNTIWQVITVPTDGDYTVRAFVGGRGGSEEWNLRLSTGDTGPNGGGDIVNITQTAPPVGNTANPQPWTRMQQQGVGLAAGTYTLSMEGPDSGSIGGLFTDLQLFTSEEGSIYSLAADDDCINTRDVTTNTVECQQWVPQTDGNCDIVSWQRLDTGETQTNDAFFAQVPAPVGCYIAPEGEEPEVTFGNLNHTYSICAGGVSLQRTLITDNSGAAVAESFTDSNGVAVGPPAAYTIGACGPQGFDNEDTYVCVDGVTALRRATFRNGFENAAEFIGPDGVALDPQPTAWTWGPCLDSQTGDDVEEMVACATLDFGGGNTGTAPVIRRLVREPDGTETVAYDLNGTDVTAQLQSFQPGPCEFERLLVCDSSGDTFIQRHGPASAANPTGIDYFDLDGNPAAPVAPLESCTPETRLVLGEVCVEHPTINTLTAPGWLLLNADGTTEVIGSDGQPTQNQQVVVCQAVGDQDRQEVLCDDNGPFLRLYTWIRVGGQIQFGGSSDYTLDGADYTTVGAVTVCEGADIELLMVCDLGTNPPTPFGLLGIFNAAGENIGGRRVDLTDGTDYNLIGAIGACGGSGSSSNDDECLQDTNGVFFRRTTTAEDGTVTVSTVDVAGNAYVPVGPVTPCSGSETETNDDECLQDTNGVFFRRTHTAADGTITVTTVDVAGAAYVPVGPVTPCAAAATETNDDECAQDTNGMFFRRTTTATDGTVTVTTVDVAGNAYVPVGPVTPCSGEDTADSELVDLCDTNAQGLTTQFLRRFTFAADGTISSQADIGLDGAAYTVTGTVGRCTAPDRENACWTTTAGGDTIFNGTIRHDDSLPAPGWILFDNNQTFVPAQTPGLTFVDCAAIEADEVVTYATTVVDVDGGVAQTFAPTANMISWTARNRNATTATIRVNGGAVLPIDVGESIGAGLTGHDINDILEDTVIIAPGDGAIRLTVTRRS